MTIPPAAAPRRPSPLGGARPKKADIEALRQDPSAPGLGVDDILSADPDYRLQMLIIGINPGLWTALVNAPFARPGNRFWPSLEQAGLLQGPLDFAAGMGQGGADAIIAAGIGITNMIDRPTVRADQLSLQELREGGQAIVEKVRKLAPKTAVFCGITAFRQAFKASKATLGYQDPDKWELLENWPRATQLWVLPQPSGLNAHHQIPDLARQWREVWDARNTTSGQAD